MVEKFLRQSKPHQAKQAAEAWLEFQAEADLITQHFQHRVKVEIPQRPQNFTALEAYVLYQWCRLVCVRHATEGVVPAMPGRVSEFLLELANCSFLPVGVMNVPADCYDCGLLIPNLCHSTGETFFGIKPIANCPLCGAEFTPKLTYYLAHGYYPNNLQKPLPINYDSLITRLEAERSGTVN
jgi:hypothetical protein